jgi:hypothetical protein
MDLSRPWTTLAPTLEGAVLAVLAATTDPLTGREVHRLCATGSEQGVRNALNRLVRQGVVRDRPKGHAVLYWLNRTHLAAAAVDVLAHLGSHLRSRIRAEVMTWRIPPVHLSMYGSAARGDGNVDSDIDLFLIRQDQVDPGDSVWQDQLGRLAESIYDWTGNHASYVEQSLEEFRALLASNPPLLMAWRLDAIDLGGFNVLDLLEQVS